MRILAPEKKCIQIDAPSGCRYTAKDGIYDVDSPGDAKAMLRFGAGTVSVTGTTRRDVGYRCGSCGFGAFFSACSRCGADTERER